MQGSESSNITRGLRPRLYQNQIKSFGTNAISQRPLYSHRYQQINPVAESPTAIHPPVHWPILVLTYKFPKIQKSGVAILNETVKNRLPTNRKFILQTNTPQSFSQAFIVNCICPPPFCAFPIVPTAATAVYGPLC
jgi:hypothetical protein